MVYVNVCDCVGRRVVVWLFSRPVVAHRVLHMVVPMMDGTGGTGLHTCTTVCAWQTLLKVTHF